MFATLAMPAPCCLQWAGALSRPPEWIAYRRHKLGFILTRILCVFVIMMTVSTVLGDECDSRKEVPNDGTSGALLASQVVEAVLEAKIPPNSTVYEAVFRILRVYKRYRGPGRLKKGRNVSLPFRSQSTLNGTGHRRRTNDCLVTADLHINRKYFLFLSDAANRQEPLRNVAPPILFSKKAKRRIRRVVCSGCAKAPAVGRLRDDSVVRGYPANLTCTFSGNPPPVVTWLKDGKPIVPTRNNNLQIHNRRLRIRPRMRRTRRRRRRRHDSQRRATDEVPRNQRRRKSRRKRPFRRRRTVQVITTLGVRSSQDVDAGIYTCLGRSILGQASAKAALTVVPPIDPGIVYPCPYDSYCLNGGTCMFFKHFGEFVCQCAEGYKGQRCQEKEVFPTFRDHRCRGSQSQFLSRGLRCPRNQPLFLWEILQQSLSAQKYKVSPWTKAHQLTWTPTHISGLAWTRYKERIPAMMRYPGIQFQFPHLSRDRISFLQNYSSVSDFATKSNIKDQTLIPQSVNLGFSEVVYNTSEMAVSQLPNNRETSQISSHSNYPISNQQISWINFTTAGQRVTDDIPANYTWYRNVGYHSPASASNGTSPIFQYNNTVRHISKKVPHPTRHQHRQHRPPIQYKDSDQWISKTTPAIKPTSRLSYLYPTSLTTLPSTNRRLNYSSSSDIELQR